VTFKGKTRVLYTGKVSILLCNVDLSKRRALVTKSPRIIREKCNVISLKSVKIQIHDLFIANCSVTKTTVKLQMQL
jgi:hypothetical protein